jgi:regulator of replication initiation timing
VKKLTETNTTQQRFELSQVVQAELATLNMRYRDMQDTMSRLITMLAAENAELKAEVTNLKNQLLALQTQSSTETHIKNKL